MSARFGQPVGPRGGTRPRICGLRYLRSSLPKVHNYWDFYFYCCNSYLFSPSHITTITTGRTRLFYLILSCYRKGNNSSYTVISYHGALGSRGSGCTALFLRLNSGHVIQIPHSTRYHVLRPKHSSLLRGKFALTSRSPLQACSP